MAVIKVYPEPSVFDEKVQLVVTGLSPKQNVTLVSTLEKRLKNQDPAVFVSYGYYTTDENGRIDTTRDHSIGGTYIGIEPMGFMWGMVVAAGYRFGTVFRQPLWAVEDTIKLYILRDHVDIKSEKQLHPEDILCNTSHQVLYVASGVTRTLVKEGRLRGALYTPPGSGPFPGVMVIEGGAPGVLEHRASLLAGHGFVVFQLIYFGYDDLPIKLEPDLSYFEEAADWFHSQKRVAGEHIGLIGSSKGNEFVMYISIKKAYVKPCVLVNTRPSYGGIMFLDGQQLPTFPTGSIYDTDYWVDTPQGMSFMENQDRMIKDTSENTYMQIEKAVNAHYLMIIGTDDHLFPPKYQQLLTDRLTKHNKSNFRVLKYSKAGHTIRAPYFPAAMSYPLAGKLLHTGGTLRGINNAQEHSWKEVISFLRHHLSDYQRSTQSSKL